MKTIEDFFTTTYMKNNARRNSMHRIVDCFLNNPSNNSIIEFGTARVDFKGCSTILHALMSREKNVKFITVDMSESYLENAKIWIERFDSDLLNYVNFVCDDQYNFMKTYKGSPFQLVYLDCDDLNKHKSLECLVECESNMLENDSLIYVDDMIYNKPNDEINKKQVFGVVDYVNNFDKLIPIDKNEEYDLNIQQTEWYNNNLINTIPNNCKVHKNGVRQYEYQILLRFIK